MNNKKYNTDILNLFESNIDEINKYSSSIMNKFRMDAFDKFKKQGIPTKEDENYKYTDLSDVFSKDYSVSFKPIDLDINIDEIFKCDVLNLDSHLTVLSRGKYIEKDRVKTLDNGVIIASMIDAAAQYPDIFDKYYNKSAVKSNDNLTNLNTAFSQDGIFIYIPKNVVTDKPIQIVDLLLDEKGYFTNTRNLIVAENSSKAEIILCDDSLASAEFLTNTVTEIFIGENAEVEFYKIQNQHNEANNLAATYINQNKDSRYTSGVFSLQSGLIRNNVFVEMNGKGCENNIYGLALPDKKQHTDNFLYINHAEPNCNSKQLFKTVLDNYATAAFNGTVYVAKNAQVTNAEQTNNNILLTDTAKVKTKPQLIIYADDVKCTHGATIGQLDEEAMFYMRARGIPRKEARMLMLYAFAYDVIKEVKIESLRNNLEDLTQRRLNGDLSLCKNCAVRVIR